MGHNKKSKKRNNDAEALAKLLIISALDIQLVAHEHLILVPAALTDQAQPGEHWRLSAQVRLHSERYYEYYEVHGLSVPER